MPSMALALLACGGRNKDGILCNSLLILILNLSSRKAQSPSHGTEVNQIIIELGFGFSGARDGSKQSQRALVAGHANCRHVIFDLLMGRCELFGIRRCAAREERR